jgi:tRNA nucleotidyltransferase (CCA-adding enzyme)
VAEDVVELAKREVLRGSSAEDLVEPLAKLVEGLVAELRPAKVILAGSLAGGEFVRGLSDVDLLLPWYLGVSWRRLYAEVGSST